MDYQRLSQITLYPNWGSGKVKVTTAEQKRITTGYTSHKVYLMFLKRIACAYFYIVLVFILKLTDIEYKYIIRLNPFCLI